VYKGLEMRFWLFAARMGDGHILAVVVAIVYVMAVEAVVV
jgi:hypothetical protein